MFLPAPPPRLSSPDRRKNKKSRVFGPPYPFFDRRALRTPVPGWQLRLHRSRLWRAGVGGGPAPQRGVGIARAPVLLPAPAPGPLVLPAPLKPQDGGAGPVWPTP